MMVSVTVRAFGDAFPPSVGADDPASHVVTGAAWIRPDVFSWVPCWMSERCRENSGFRRLFGNCAPLGSIDRHGKGTAMDLDRQDQVTVIIIAVAILVLTAFMVGLLF